MKYLMSLFNFYITFPLPHLLCAIFFIYLHALPPFVSISHEIGRRENMRVEEDLKSFHFSTAIAITFISWSLTKGRMMFISLSNISQWVAFYFNPHIFPSIWVLFISTFMGLMFFPSNWIRNHFSFLSCSKWYQFNWKCDFDSFHHHHEWKDVIRVLHAISIDGKW